MGWFFLRLFCRETEASPTPTLSAEPLPSPLLSILQFLAEIKTHGNARLSNAASVLCSRSALPAGPGTSAGHGPAPSAGSEKLLNCRGLGWERFNRDKRCAESMKQGILLQGLLAVLRFHSPTSPEGNVIFNYLLLAKLILCRLYISDFHLPFVFARWKGVHESADPEVLINGCF